MTTLTPARRPLVCANMTREELIREAEHTFTSPTPLLALMLAHLRGDAREPQTNAVLPKSSGYKAEGAVHCPSCGAQLHIHQEQQCL